MASAGNSLNRGLSSSVPNMDQMLPLIKKEQELHKLLTDEKIRGDKHKNNFQSLKSQFELLQQEYNLMKNRLNAKPYDVTDEISKYQAVISKLETQLKSKEKEVSDLKEVSITPEKYDMLKLEVLQELQVPFKIKIDQLEEEINDYRSRYNALRHDYSFLKSEFDFFKKEQEKLTKENQIKYQADIEALKEDKEQIVKSFNSGAEKESEKIKNLLKENAHLVHRVKSLEQTIEEKDAQAESQSNSSDHVSRFQAKQLVELNGKNKVLEATNRSLNAQIEGLKEEMKMREETSKSQQDKIFEVEKENLTLKNKIEEIKHEESLSKNNQKMESIIAYNEIVKERDTLKNELEDTLTKYEALQHATDRQKIVLAQKEREMTRRVQGVKDSEWLKLTQLQEKNAELEAKVQDYQNSRSNLISKENDEKLRLQEKIGSVEREKAECEKEITVIKALLDTKTETEKELERERNEVANLKRKILSFENELMTSQNIESEMMSDFQRVKSTNESLKQQNLILKQELETLYDRNNAEKSHFDSKWATEKMRYNERIQYLESQVEKMTAKLRKAGQIHQRKKRFYQMNLSKLQEKADMLEDKEHRLESERVEMTESVPLREFNNVKQKLNKAEKRYNDLSQAKSDPFSSQGQQFNPSKKTSPHNMQDYQGYDQESSRNTRPARTEKDVVKFEDAFNFEFEHAPSSADEKRVDLEGLEKGFIDETICAKADRSYLKELENLKERLRRLSLVQRQQMKDFLGNEEAEKIEKSVLDTDKVKFPMNSLSFAAKDNKNVFAEYEISDFDFSTTVSK